MSADRIIWPGGVVNKLNRLLNNYGSAHATFASIPVDPYVAVLLPELPAVKMKAAEQSEEARRRVVEFVQQLEYRVLNLEAALRFYADEKNYEATDFVDVGVGGAGIPIPGSEEVMADHGQMAREALK